MLTILDQFDQLLQTWYIHSLEAFLVYIFRFFENVEIWGDFLKKKIKKCLKISKFPKFLEFQKSDISILEHTLFEVC